jgi:ATP phosphoribosyltransferase
MKKLRMAIPKGRLYENVTKLLEEIGLKIVDNGRSYRPYINDPEIGVKVLKPQNIPKIVEVCSCDVGFTGYDLIVEMNAKVKELLDLESDTVRIVVAVPRSLRKVDLKKRRIRVASEYERITKDFLSKEGYNYIFVRSFGATEVFPPEDAEMIIDNTSTGRTLKENNLVIMKTLMESSTRFIANRESLRDPWKREKINKIVMLLRAVLDGKKRVLLEMNVPKEKLKKIMKVLPSMKSPTVQGLYNGDYAVKVAVKKSEVNKIIPLMKKLGARDILEYELKKVMV